MKSPGAVNATRLVLGVAGVALVGYGLIGLPLQLGPSQLVGLLTWMACALLLHDGVIVPLSTVAGAGLRRLTFALRPASAAVLRGALMLGAVVSALAGILVKAQSVSRTTSVLEGDYAGRLVWFWAGLALATAVLIYLFERTGQGRGSRRQKSRP